MAANRNVALTDEQRAALAPLVQTFERAYGELEAAIEALRRSAEPSDAPEPTTSCISCTCGSFLGRGNKLNEACGREFCGHPLMHHLVYPGS